MVDNSLDKRLRHLHDIIILLRKSITVFPLSFDIEIQGPFKDFQGPSNLIFKDQFWTEVYSKSSRTAIFNVYLCEDGTVIR